MIVTLAAHPTGRDVLVPGGAGDHAARIGVFAHAVAIASVPLLLFGLLGLTRRLRSESALAELAYVAYALGCVAVVCAASFSGFVATGVARQIVAGNEGGREVVKALFAYTGVLNQAFANVHLVATSAAILLWSIAILRDRSFPAGVGTLGAIVGAASLLGSLSGHFRMTLHGLLVLVVTQGVWTIWIALLLRREAPPDPAASGAAPPLAAR